MLSLLNVGLDVTMDSRNYGVFAHDEAYVTKIARMVKLLNLVRI